MSDSSSDIGDDVDETAVVVDSHVDVNIRRLQEEEQLLQERHVPHASDQEDANDEAAIDSVLRVHELQQQELQQHQQQTPRHSVQELHHQRREKETGAVPRRTICTVRVNALHESDAIETDV